LPEEGGGTGTSGRVVEAEEGSAAAEEKAFTVSPAAGAGRDEDVPGGSPAEDEGGDSAGEEFEGRTAPADTGQGEDAAPPMADDDKTVFRPRLKSAMEARDGLRV